MQRKQKLLLGQKVKACFILGKTIILETLSAVCSSAYIHTKAHVILEPEAGSLTYIRLRMCMCVCVLQLYGTGVWGGGGGGRGSIINPKP